jgi:hypothetical protein
MMGFILDLIVIPKNHLSHFLSEDFLFVYQIDLIFPEPY